MTALRDDLRDQIVCVFFFTLLRIILLSSLQSYTKSATTNFKHGSDPPPPPLKNVKKTDDLVSEVVPFRHTCKCDRGLFFYPSSQDIGQSIRFYCLSYFKPRQNQLNSVWDCVIRADRQKLISFNDGSSHMSCLLLTEAKILPLLVELRHRAFSTKKPAQEG